MHDRFHLIPVPNRIAAAAGILGILLSPSIANAQEPTGGTPAGIDPGVPERTPDPVTPTPAVPSQPDSIPPMTDPAAPAKQRGPCIPTEQIKSTKDISDRCERFILRTLRRSVYDDLRDDLALATWKKEYNRGTNTSKVKVNGLLDVPTAKGILKGKAMNPKSPDPNSKGHEIFVRVSNQTASVLDNGRINHMLSVSTGAPGNETRTPRGSWRINERVMGSGYTNPSGGIMYYALFFYRGYAAHAGIVHPKIQPESHGCTRFDFKTMRYIIRGEKTGTHAFTTGDKIKVVD